MLEQSVSSRCPPVFFLPVSSRFIQFLPVFSQISSRFFLFLFLHSSSSFFLIFRFLQFLSVLSSFSCFYQFPSVFSFYFPFIIDSSRFLTVSACFKPFFLVFPFFPFFLFFFGSPLLFFTHYDFRGLLYLRFV